MSKNTIFRFSGFFLLVGLFALLLSCSKEDEKEYEFPDPPSENKDKPRFIWIDAAANFKDFANSPENIARDLKLAKDAGFTDVVVDIRPTNGDILFQSDVPGARQVEWLGAWVDGVYSKVPRTATFDYMQAFIDKGHELGLKVHAGFNTMTGGHGNALGNQGILYRDASKKDWATTQNLASGLLNTMDRSSGTKFFNPAHDEVQAWLIELLKDLATYNLDGIFLDRGRYEGIQSDFSEITRKKFEAYLGGVPVPNFPDDILLPGTTMLEVMAMKTYPPYLKQWHEFRAKVMYDFMEKARDAVKSVNSKIKFGVYVGAWYSTYYEVGVNWGSKKYNTAANYNWASSKYNNYGYAALMDHMLIGAYANPKNVYGTYEWSMQGFCSLAMDKIKNDCPMVAGGPDVGNWDPKDEVSQADENQAIVNSVKACMDECDGYFLFDMIHLKMANQWQYAKQGIELATK